MHNEKMARRDFMKGAVMGGAGLGLGGSLAANASLKFAQDEGATPAPAPDPNAGADAPLPVGKVPRRALGKTGETIPMLFMGGSQKFDPKYDKMLHRAYKMGIDYIDSGQIYAGGQAQLTTAPFLQQVGRDKIWVTSKVSLVGDKVTPDNYKKNLDECLNDLQTDYLNAFFMHMINDERYLEPELIKMGDDVKKSGKAKYFGFSCHDGNVPELLEKAARVGGIDMILFKYSFAQYGDTKLNKAIDACVAAGIGLMAMKTQSSVPDDLEAVKNFQSKNFTLPQAKLKSVWADERISGTVSGMTNIQILMENATAALSPEKLTMEEYHQLNKLARLTAPYNCLGCTHICESKIDGKLKVADALRFLMYDECYKDPETARLLYHALSPEERDFENVDLSEAIKACPQGIQIDQRLAKARQVLMA